MAHKSFPSVRTCQEEDFGIFDEPTLGDLDERLKIEDEVQGMIGMESAKAFFLETKEIVQYLEGGGNPQILRTSLNMVITGNPGAVTHAGLCLRACVRACEGRRVLISTFLSCYETSSVLEPV
jgi:hypothetical protein